MKRTRFGTRTRLSRDASELQRLATGLAESGGKLEDAYWESELFALVDALLRNGAEDDLNSALDRLHEANPPAHDELADMIEACAETSRLVQSDKTWDVLLFAAPILAWSRFSIPTLSLPGDTLQALNVQLGAHAFASNARLALADFLFSPDQLPRSFCDTWQLTRQLAEAAQQGQNCKVDSSQFPETNRFLSDVRYLIGAVAVPQGAPIFRWNEKDGSKESALAAWQKQGNPNLEPLLPGCAWQVLLPDAYHAACRNADRNSRPFSVAASLTFLHTSIGLQPDQTRAVIGPCYDTRMEEYRVSLGPLDSHAVYHGIVWPLLGNEDEATDVAGEIESVLREAGVRDICFLDHHFPMEFCDDCGAPLFPDSEGELVHAEMPEEAASPSPHLH